MRPRGSQTITIRSTEIATSWTIGGHRGFEFSLLELPAIADHWDADRHRNLKEVNADVAERAKMKPLVTGEDPGIESMA